MAGGKGEENSGKATGQVTPWGSISKGDQTAPSKGVVKEPNAGDGKGQGKGEGGGVGEGENE